MVEKTNLCHAQVQFQLQQLKVIALNLSRDSSAKFTKWIPLINLSSKGFFFSSSREEQTGLLWNIKSNVECIYYAIILFALFRSHRRLCFALKNLKVS